MRVTCEGQSVTQSAGLGGDMAIANRYAGARYAGGATHRHMGRPATREVLRASAREPATSTTPIFYTGQCAGGVRKSALRRNAKIQAAAEDR